LSLVVSFNDVIGNREIPWQKQRAVASVVCDRRTKSGVGGGLFLDIYPAALRCTEILIKKLLRAERNIQN
jgi:hypothetical protein